MHGLIANQLRSYAIERLGRDVWTLVAEADDVALPADGVSLTQTYPDAAIIAAVVRLSAAAGTDVPVFLEDFGAYLAGPLLRVYAPLLKPDWKTLDVIEKTEESIHTVVRLRDPQAGPPYLTARRVSPTEVDLIYTSSRRLCFLGEGIARGIADHFGERIAIHQPECMHRGDARCLIKIQLAD